MSRYQFTPQAVDDLFEIWSYIAGDNLDAADHGGDGAATGAVLQDERGILAEPAEFLRFGSDKAVGKGFGDRAASTAGGCG